MEQEKPMVCTDKDFGRFYVALKLNLKKRLYQIFSVGRCKTFTNR